MKKIRNLHTLQLEKTRLQAECKMKAQQLHHRINHIDEALPDLLLMFLPQKVRSVWSILSSIIQTFAGGGEHAPNGNSTGEGQIFQTAFRLFKKLFARNKEKRSETETP